MERLRQLIEANAYLGAALVAAQEGDHSQTEKHIDQAIVEMTFASTTA